MDASPELLLLLLLLLLLQEDPPDELELETLVIDQISTGLNHTKIDFSNPLLYNFQAAAAANR